MRFIGIDEAAFVDQKLYEVFLPMLKVDCACMFIASSPPLDSAHWFNILRAKRLPFYRDFALQGVCTECQYEKPMKEWKNCSHITVRMQTNVNKRKRDAVSELGVSEVSDKRENFGVVVEEDDRAFDARHIERFFDVQNRVIDLGHIEKIIICFDPSAGGENDTGAACLAIVDGLLVFLWIDYIPANKGPEFLRFLKATVYSCSKHFRKGNYTIPIAVAIEANGRLDGEFFNMSVIQETDKEFTNVHVIGDVGRKSETKGVNLFARRKSDFLLHFSVNLDANRIRLYRQVGTNNPKKIHKILESAQAQLIGLRLSDKSAKKAKFNDDMALAILMCIFWIYHFYTHMDYAPQREQLTFPRT